VVRQSRLANDRKGQKEKQCAVTFHSSFAAVPRGAAQWDAMAAL
jgi:hypothetical protein